MKKQQNKTMKLEQKREKGKATDREGIKFHQNPHEPLMPVFSDRISNCKELEAIAKCIYYTGCTVCGGELTVFEFTDKKTRKIHPEHCSFAFSLNFVGNDNINIAVFVRRDTFQVQYVFAGDIAISNPRDLIGYIISVSDYDIKRVA